MSSKSRAASFVMPDTLLLNRLLRPNVDILQKLHEAMKYIIINMKMNGCAPLIETLDAILAIRV